MLPVLFSLILGLTHFWNEKITIKQEFTRVRLLSFVAGISITYVFLNLLPEVYSGFKMFDKFIFVALLVGFSAAHLTEKYFYQHSAPETLREKLKLIHGVAFFTYHLLIGVILVKLNNQSNLDSVLFFFPVLFYSGVGVIALGKIHTKVWEKFYVKMFLSASTLIGVLVADLLIGFDAVFNLLFGFIVGIFLYLAMIDFIPKEAKGRPEYFALGVLTYTLIIIATII